jgi:hypothetical protein
MEKNTIYIRMRMMNVLFLSVIFLLITTHFICLTIFFTFYGIDILDQIIKKKEPILMFNIC